MRRACSAHNSLNCTPGTLVGMALSGPRYWSGASGLGSQVSSPGSRRGLAEKWLTGARVSHARAEYASSKCRGRYNVQQRHVSPLNPGPGDEAMSLELPAPATPKWMVVLGWILSLLPA